MNNHFTRLYSILVASHQLVALAKTYVRTARKLTIASPSSMHVNFDLCARLDNTRLFRVG